MRKECSVERNKVKCTCTYSNCVRKGLCCECIAYHRAQDQLPGCVFPPDVERTYDRSIARFISCHR